MAKIIHAVVIHASRKKIYRAITTQEGLSNWWTKTVTAEPKVGGIADFQFANEFGATMEIVDLDKEKRVEWKCTGGAEEWLGSLFVFELSDRDGSVLLMFTQTYEQEISDVAYGTYNFNWAYYLQSLKEYCETGKGKPFDRR